MTDGAPTRCVATSGILLHSGKGFADGQPQLGVGESRCEQSVPSRAVTHRLPSCQGSRAPTVIDAAGPKPLPIAGVPTRCGTTSTEDVAVRTSRCATSLLSSHRADLAYTGVRTDRNDVCSQPPSDIEDFPQWFALDHHYIGRVRRNASSPERTFEPLRRTL